MKKIAVIVLLIAGVFATVAYAQGTSDQAPASGAGDAVAAAQSAKDAITQPKDLTIYGEVQAVNAAANSMTVQYYDYDTDEEKSVELAASAETKIENAAALADIKKGDWADITYMTQGSKNVAKSIIVEKEEEVPAETMPEGEIKE